MVETAAKAIGEWAGKLVMDEFKLLRGLGDKVNYLQDQLRWMEACLDDSKKLGDKSCLLRLYISEVKKLGEESRDVIQSYLERVVMEGDDSSNWLSKSVSIIRTIQPRHEVDSKINVLMKKMSALEANLKLFRVDLILDRGITDTSTSTAAAAAVTGDQKAEGIVPKGALEMLVDEIVTLQEEQEKYPDLRADQLIVGRVAEELDVIEWLVKTEEEVRFVTVCGVRGMGKTVLAKLIFGGKKKIRRHFDNCYWVHASGDLDFGYFLGRVYRCVVRDSRQRDYDELAEQKLVYELQNANRFLMVLDDVRDAKLLENIVHFFSSNMTQGSKVLLTMRDRELAGSIRPSNARRVYDLLPMDEKDGWMLLHKTMKWHGIEGLDAKEHELAKKMLSKCEGNPLAIVTLGMACARKPIEEWEDTCDTILLIVYPERRFEHALKTTYKALPDSLKSCVLHLSHFPVNYQIPVAVVLRMWIAEGFVPSVNKHSRSEEYSLEDIARDMLNQLVDLSLVQVDHESITMHELVRKFFLHMASAEGLIHLIKPAWKPESNGPGKCKMMAIYLDESLDSFDEAYKHESKEQLKSLFTYPVNGSGIEHEHYSKFLVDVCAKFTWLRTLHLQRFPVGGSFPEQIKNMTFLRYLSLKGTCITNVPSSVGSLTFLQVLDLRVCCTPRKVVNIPNTLCKATRLIYLFLPAGNYQITDKNQVLLVDTLIYLETLKNVDVSKFRTHDLFKLTKMRNLSLKLTKKDIQRVLLSPVVTSRKNLQRLSIRVKGAAIAEKSGKKLQNPLLYRLDVEGRIFEQFSVKMFPPWLEVLKLECSELKDDPMLVLMWLPNLRSLTLGKDSFLGATMICCADGFAQLEKLKLASLPNFDEWKIEEGALLKLKQLVIDRCDKFRTRPRHLPIPVKVIGIELTKGVFAN